MSFWDIFRRRKSDKSALVKSSHSLANKPDFHNGSGVILKTVGDVLSNGLDLNSDRSNAHDPLSLYEASVWAFTCASLIARTIASIPLEVYLDGEKAPDEDLLVVLLKQPAPKWSYNRFAQASALYQTLTGSVYWAKERYESSGRSEWMKAPQSAAKPGELWVYGEDSWATTVATTGKPVVEYYTDKDGNQVEPSEAMQALYVKPGVGNEGEGASPARASREEARADTKAAEWNNNSLDNRMVPPGVFKLKVQPVSDLQYKQNEQRLKNAYQGAKNAGKPMVLGTEVDWIALAQSAVEMDFISGRKLTRETICAAYGVPPVLVGILDRATYSNYDIAQEVFWVFTILPLIRIWLDVLNSELAPEFGSGYQIRANTRLVMALLRQLERKWSIVEKMLDRGIPMAVANEFLELGLPAYPGSELGLVPANLVPFDLLTGNGSD